MVHWVTSRSSDQHETGPTAAPDFISPSKPEDPETGGTDPSAKGSKVMLKLGRSSKQDSPTGLTSMQVKFIGILPRPHPLSSPFYRSRSLPSGSSSKANRRPMSRSTSCEKCPLFRKPVPTMYGKRAVLLTLRDRPPLQRCRTARGVRSFVHKCNPKCRHIRLVSIILCHTNQASRDGVNTGRELTPLFNRMRTLLVWCQSIPSNRPLNEPGIIYRVVHT